MLLWQWRRAAPQSVARRRGPVAALVAVALAAALVPALAFTSRPALSGTLRASGGEQAHLPEYGERGSVIVRYRHGETTTIAVRLVNAGLLPITVEAVDPFLTPLGLATADTVTADGDRLPVRLGPRESAEVEIRARFDHCAYFTERAIDPSTHARVTWRLGPMTRTSLVAYPQALLVRSPTIVDCPGRVLDRSAKRRNAEGTVTGRG